MSEGSGENLHVHAVPLVFPGVAGVVRSVGGDPVDRQQGAVQDHERLRRGRLHRLGQGRRDAGQHVDGLADVSVDGCDPDAESSDELGIGVAAPQVSQRKVRLTASSQGRRQRVPISSNRAMS